MTRRVILMLAFLATACSNAAPGEPSEAEVMDPVRAFYTAFDEGFTQPARYATEDWNHLNPLGGRTKSRDETLAQVREVHQSFLKGVTETIESSDVRFATDDVAVATVVSRSSPHGIPSDPEAKARRQIRTFVVVRRDDRWQIMQDHNTFIADAAPAQGRE